MKKSFIISVLAIASAFAFLGCNKEVAPEAVNGNVVKFTINANAPETKTYIVYDGTAKTYTPNWNNGDLLGVFFDSWTENTSAVHATFENTLADGATASFSGEGTVSSSEQVIYAFYPASKFAKAYKNHVLGITIPDVQKPTATSFDKDADILVNKPYPVTISSTNVVIDDMQFCRVLSTLKLVVSDETGESILSSDNIKSITLTTNDPNAALTGRYQWDFVNESGAINDNVKANHVTADLASNPIALDGSSPIYFLVNPTTLASGSDLVINISTDKHEITKTASLPKAFEFPAGKVANLSITIKDTDTVNAAITEPKTPGWHLVQSSSWLKVGDNIVITNETPDQALGSQNGTYRDPISVSTTDGLLNPGSATQLELVAGATTGTFALKAGSKYLAYSGTKNQLVENDDITAISSWNIVVTTSATSIQNSSNTGYYIQYNPNTGQERFSCYTGTQSPIHIYKQYTAPDTREESEIAWSDTDGMGDVKEQELVLPSLSNPHNLTVTYFSSDETVATVAANAHTVTLLKAGQTEIHAVFAGNDDYKPADVYYTLDVDDTRAVVTLSFGTASYDLTIGTNDYDDFTGQVVTADPSVAVTYALTGAAVGTLNTSTGAVSLDDTTVGTATITASFAGNATLKPAEDASYTISVSAAAPSGVTGDETFDLSTNTYTTGTNSVTWTGESVVINNSGTNATNYLGGDANNRTSSRFYNGNTLTIAPNDDYTITSIVFTATSTNYAGVLGTNSTWTNAAASVNGTEVTVTPANGSANVSATVSGTCGFTSIVINYIFTGVVASKYAITIDNSIANGTVTASKTTGIAENEQITLTITPANNYALGTLTVDSVNVTSQVSNGTYSFNMPAHDVSVSATFTSTGGGGSTPPLQYTLTPASGSNNSYTGNCDIDIDGITWNLTGNSTTQPWRIGGKSLSGVDRALYSKTALAKNISKIEITHGSASSITVNSMTVIVSKNDDFSSPISTLTPGFVANGPVEVVRPDGKDWSNCYYKIVYNVTVSGTSNKFVEFSEAKFYGTN